jgi:hypothetical protein
MRKEQTINKYPSTILALGDSQTDTASNYGVLSANMWTATLCKMLNKDEKSYQPRVFARSGYTTNQILGIADCIFMYDTHTIGIIYAGVNDPGSSVATSTAQGGTLSTITLQVNSLSRQNSYVGQTVRVGGDIRTIIAYDTTTLVATVNQPFTTAPTSSTTYTIDAPSQAQTQANLQALAKCFKYCVKGVSVGTGSLVSVWNTSMLPKNAKVGDRMIVMQDVSPTGGCKNNIVSSSQTIIANYSSSPTQAVWECRNSLAGEAGWSRVAISSTAPFTDGCQNVVIVTPNYQNWSTGGDNYNTITNAGTRYTAYVSIRQTCIDASQAESVKACDLYDYMSKLIYAGQDGSAMFEGVIVYPEVAQGDFAWHYIDGNQHHNEYGHLVVARAVYLSVQA